MENLKKEIWTQDDYNEYIKYLKKLENKKYKEFHSKLTTTKYEILGLSVPIQRKIVKEISKGNIESFLKYTKDNYYEEIMIKGFAIAKIKDKEILLKYLDNYVDLIDNWAICDCVCSSLKIINQDKDYWFSYLSKYIDSKKEFRVRVAFVIFLNFYVEEKYLDEIFKLIDKVKIDKYYVNMAISWLLCECFIKYPEKTLKFLLKSQINSFTFNKTISKIKDSYRVSKEDKDYLSSLRKKV